MSYGKRVQLDSLFDPRQSMSTTQSLEIQLTPVVNQEQDLVDFICLSIRVSTHVYQRMGREGKERKGKKHMC